MASASNVSELFGDDSNFVSYANDVDETLPPAFKVSVGKWLGAESSKYCIEH